MIVFVCNRSGFYKPKELSARKRKSTAYGSRKINSICPAKIKATFSGSNILVEYSLNHVGHEDTNKLCYMSIPTSTRENIASQLIKNVPPDSVITNIKHPLPTDESERQRKHIATRHDIRNVGDRYGAILPERYDKSDALSVRKWAVINKDSVLYYKEQDTILNDEFSSLLRKDDFVLVVMTKKQKEVLRSFGSNVIAMDSTHGLNGYDFPLTTVMVIDETNRGYPVAFMFSNTVNEAILEVFFRSIEKTIGDLKPKTFMTDMALEFYNAWKKVFPEPQFHLFCTWHVLRAWKDNLNKVCASGLNLTQKDVISIKKQLYRFLRCDLMREMDPETFLKELDAFLSTKNVLLKDFQSYFETYYASCVKQWAYCHRKEAGINVNMVCEAFHKVLKWKHLKGRKIKRMDKALKAILDYLDKRLENEIIEEERCSIEAYKPRIIAERHKKSLWGTLDQIFPYKNYWAAESFSESQNEDKHVKEIYIIEERMRVECSKNCKLICAECNTCSHKFTCSCPDNAILSNMCKHIHLLCKFLAANPVQEHPKEPVEELVQEFSEELVEVVTDIEDEDEGGDEAASIITGGKNATPGLEEECEKLIKNIIDSVQNVKSKEKLHTIKAQLKIIEATCMLPDDEIISSFPLKTLNRGEKLTGPIKKQPRLYRTSKQRKQKKSTLDE